MKMEDVLFIEGRKKKKKMMKKIFSFNAAGNVSV